MLNVPTFRIRSVLLIAALLTLGSIQVEQFGPVGSFAHVRSSTGEHCYGYSLELWRHNGRIIGLFDHHEGLCGDPPCEVLQNVSYDPGTGHLSFTALSERFIGTLRRDDVVGTIDGAHVRLARERDDLMDAARDKSFVEWCTFWRSVHRCRGVDAVCSTAVSRTGFKTVSSAGPVCKQPHGLLGPTNAVTGDGPAAGHGAPRLRPPAIGFETTSRNRSTDQSSSRRIRPIQQSALNNQHFH